MLLGELLERLNQIAAEDEDYLELNVVYSKDSEGNRFYNVEYLPTLGVMEDNEFYTEQERIEGGFTDICIN